MNEEIKCKTHPDAPHGFVRNASHTEDRYVCECEYWEEPKVNERIKELAEQAGFIDRGSNHTAYMSFDHEKFAELIVKECVNWIDGSPTTEEGTLILSKSFIIANLKQHFGVTE